MENNEKPTYRYNHMTIKFVDENQEVLDNSIVTEAGRNLYRYATSDLVEINDELFNVVRLKYEPIGFKRSTKYTFVLLFTANPPEELSVKVGPSESKHVITLEEVHRSRDLERTVTRITNSAYATLYPVIEAWRKTLESRNNVENEPEVAATL